MYGFDPLGVASRTSWPASTSASMGTTVSLRYWPVGPVPPPCISMRVALEPITSTLPLLIRPPGFVRWTRTIWQRVGDDWLKEVKFDASAIGAASWDR